MAKYFITGGTGFLGSHLVQKARSENNEVFCLSRQNSSQFENSDSVHWIEGDLFDSSTYKDALKDTDCVFHLAGLLSARRKEDFMRVNVDGTASLLKACREAGFPLKRFVYISSIAALGPSYEKEFLKETDRCMPLTEYGKSKELAEQIVLDYKRIIPVVILRPPFIYGRGDLRGLKFLQSLNNPISLLWASNIKTISLCHVSDIIQGCLLSVHKDIESGEIFNISDPDVTTWSHVWEALNDLVNELLGISTKGLFSRMVPFSGMAVSHDSIEQESKRYQFWACDVSKAKEILGFIPEMPFRKGAYDTMSWYLEQGLIGERDLEQILEGFI
jgi:nucleoside-diphosphate-sugar epimerase